MALFPTCAGALGTSKPYLPTSISIDISVRFALSLTSKPIKLGPEWDLDIDTIMHSSASRTSRDLHILCHSNDIHIGIESAFDIQFRCDFGRHVDCYSYSFLEFVSHRARRVQVHSNGSEFIFSAFSCDVNEDYYLHFGLHIIVDLRDRSLSLVGDHFPLHL